MGNNHGAILIEALATIPTLIMTTCMCAFLIGLFTSKIWVENIFYNRLICEIKDGSNCESQFSKALGNTPWVHVFYLKIKKRYDRQKYKEITGQIRWGSKHIPTNLNFLFRENSIYSKNQTVTINKEMAIRERDFRK